MHILADIHSAPLATIVSLSEQHSLKNEKKICSMPPTSAPGNEVASRLRQSVIALVGSLGNSAQERFHTREVPFPILPEELQGRLSLTWCLWPPGDFWMAGGQGSHDAVIVTYENLHVFLQ